MNKKLGAVLALVCLVGSGAFAQLAIGGATAIYSDTEMSFSETMDQFQKGDGAFYGGFLELGLGNIGLGLSALFSFYEEDYSFFYDGSDMRKMMDYDVSLYLQGHLFGYKAFLDPFLEFGLGVMAKDFADNNDPDPNNPLYGAKYWDFGGGLGLNFGSLGFFAKGLYMFPTGTMKGTYKDSNGVTQEYPVEVYPLKKLKVILGLKLIL